MGNSGVALLESPAGLIYNPLVSTWKMGRGSLAAGILVTESIEITVDATIPGSYNSVNGTFNSRQSAVNSRTLAGLGWGQNAFVCGDECELHLGAALFLSYQSSKRNLFVSFTEPTDRNALFTVQDGSASSFSLQPSLGGVWEIASTWSAGFRVDLPSILLKVDRKGFQSFASVVDNAGTEILNTIQTDVAEGAPAFAQWGVSGGLQWTPAGAWLVLADINIFEARRSVESGPTSVAISDVGGGFRYAFDPKWALMAGTRFSLQDLFKAGESTGDRTLDWLTSIGVSMASEHLESTFGFFADRVVLLERRTVSDGTFAFSSEKTEVYGLLLSGLYRF